MIINSLHIISFGGLNDRVIDLDKGVNIVDGANETGKTSAAMFIKFIFYGLQSKALKADGASERTRYINRDTLKAAGYIMATADDGNEYKLERAIIASDGSTPRERIRITNQTTGESITGQNPGEYFFGVPESVFVGTAFVGQNKSVKPDIAGDGTAKGSVENLLTSADENIDIKRAVKKLDAVRRELCHKNGSGGEISSLRERRAALKAERDETAGRAAEILSLSSSVADIKARIAQFEETSARHRKIFAALDKIETKKKFDALDATGRSIADIANSVKLIDDSPVGGGFRDAVAEAERDIRAYDEEKAAYDARKNSFPDTYEIPETPDRDEVVAESKRLEKQTRLFFSLGVGSLIGGIVALVAAVVLYLLNTGKYVVPFIAAIILAAVGIGLIVYRGVSAKKLSALLDEWKAESADDMEDALDARIAVIDETRALVEEKKALTDSLVTARGRRDAAERTVIKLAESVKLKPSDDVYTTVKTLRDIADAAQEEKAALLTKSDKMKGRLEVLAEQLDGIDRGQAMTEAKEVLATAEGEYAAELSQDEIKNLLKEKEFTDNALISAVKRKESLDERLGETGKLSRSPDELETMIKSLDEKITELSLRHDACELAQTALTKAGEAMRSDVIPRLGERASEYINGSTGKYSRMTVDGSFSCGLGEGDDYKTAELFSRGTADLVYIALRTALAEEVFRADRPTVVFDESFAHVDSTRLSGMINMLARTGGQYIVFTCRREEADAAKALGCNIISL